MGGKVFKCELSWSVSRHKEWQRCRREAWYARYASWNWWNERPRAARYEAMLHKNLTSLPAFAGDCMHRAIEGWFERARGGQRLSAEALFERARSLFREGWRESNGGDWQARPNKSVHLFEHHYQVPLEKDRTDAVRDLLERCARYFTESAELAPAREAHPDSWLALETLDSFDFEGVKLYAVPDFAHRDGQRVRVWDWKTGRPRDEDVLQAKTYALYASERWGAEPSEITLHLAYLGVGEVRTLEIDPSAIGEARDAIRDSLTSIRAAHYDPDHELPDMSRFEPSPEARRCAGCRFRALCDAAVS